MAPGSGRERGGGRPGVDFGYAFGPPHRLTAGLPDRSERTLVDVEPGGVRLAWSYEDLTGYPSGIYRTPPASWAVRLVPQVDGQVPGRSQWTRLDGWLPALWASFEDEAGAVRLQVAGAASATLVGIRVRNSSGEPHRLSLVCESQHWGENPAWVDPSRWPGDHLVAGWAERADRVLVLGVGAAEYGRGGDGLPGSRTLVMSWSLGPGEQASAWLVRPYRAYAAELDQLRSRDWEKEWTTGLEVWRSLLARARAPSVPDLEVEQAFRACLADLFIMREPIAGGQIAAVPGTEVYRAANVHEAAVVAVALDQVGLHDEAAAGYAWCLETQGADGNWNDPAGWAHLMWSAAGFKAWAAMEHYRLTGDRAYLAKAYPHMLASSRWQEGERARTRVMAAGEWPATYGLLPRGFGDCGLRDGEDLYGVFLPHNIWAVYADRLALEAAQILGQDEDVPELQTIWESSQADLLAALEVGAISEPGYRWIPGVAGRRSGSRWGALNALFPCELLPGDHPLVSGTLRHLEAHLSPGGLPLNTGWLADGMWVAIALDNVAEAHLARGDGDAAARYLYAVLNHGTPLHTWCEERGPEPGTTTCTGDRQHLWTPVAVVRCLRDCLVMEEGEGLHLARGTHRDWLGSGGAVGFAGAPTRLGPVSFQLQYDPHRRQVGGRVDFGQGFRGEWALLHVRLPEGLRLTSVEPESGAQLVGEGQCLRWRHPAGVRRFTAEVA
ncbi:MAG: hypothetical protein ABIL09_00180 [Gemmatimonadota bacterium]